MLLVVASRARKWLSSTWTAAVHLPSAAKARLYRAARRARRIRRCLRRALTLGAAIAAVTTLVFTYLGTLQRQYIILANPVDGDWISGQVRIGGHVAQAYVAVDVTLAPTDGPHIMRATEFPTILNTESLSDGKYTLLVKVYTKAFGLFRWLGQVTSVQVRVKNTAPQVKVRGLQEHQVVRNTDKVEVLVDRGYVEQLTLDGSRLVWGAPAESMSFTIGSLGLLDGPHTLTIVAKDEAGNREEPKPVPFIVDNTPPVVSDLGLEDAQLVSGILNLEPRVDDSTRTEVSWFVDGELRFVGSRYEWDTEREREGTRILELRATDAAGNEVSAFISVVVDNTKPSLRASLPGGATEFFRYSILPIDVISSEEVVLSLLINEQEALRSQPPGRLLVDLSAYDHGASLRLSIRGSDLAGNEADPVEVTITVSSNLCPLARSLVTYDTAKLRVAAMLIMFMAAVAWWSTEI